MFLSSADIVQVRKDCHSACQQGQSVIFRNEGLSFDDLDLLSFPVRYKPFSRELYERITWADDCNIICYIAKKEIDDLDVTIEGLRRYDKIVIAKLEYDIQHIVLQGGVGDNFAYILVGGVRK